MTEGKRCRKCSVLLNATNWNQSSRKKNDNICKNCKGRELRAIEPKVVVEEKDGHTITTVGNKAPVVTVKPGEILSLKRMIEDTELFRIEEVIKFLLPGNEDKDRKVAVDYLLKVKDLLTDPQKVQVVNLANSMIMQAGVEDSFKLKVAIALRNFISAKDGKKEKKLSYEEIMAKGAGEITIGEDDEV